MNNITDRFGRRLTYLRVSVTDRCNFRCKYCMPDSEFTRLKCEDILRYEDILFIAEIFASFGVNRIRITGGEPLVRKGLCGFLSGLSKIKGINEIMMTTNGALLRKYADALAGSGVTRLNISLDSLKGERNKYITGFDKTADILEGIKAAGKAGLTPIKVNSVIIRGFNDDEIGDFARLSAEYGVICRFIEFMPIGNSENWNKDSIVSGGEILDRLKEFEPVEMKRDMNTGPAVNYRLNNGGIIGIITPISKHFCDSCDKVRLTADGKIRPCLLSDREIDIREAVKKRDGDKITYLIKKSLNVKDDGHHIDTGENKHDFKRTMSKIGG